MGERAPASLCSLAWRAIEAASCVEAARRPWHAWQHPRSASCTGCSGSNSLLTAPIEAGYSAERHVQSRGGPGAGADRRRPRRPRPPPLACAGSVLALAAFAGPAQCSRVGSSRHRADHLQCQCHTSAAPTSAAAPRRPSTPTVVRVADAIALLYSGRRAGRFAAMRCLGELEQLDQVHGKI